ncbi:MAG TPA: ASKHA domain-containing protein [Humidesulfovibrio sp.]|uniref:ASKHA domain-containing protein n=1 Tax=Humidesulfovibrio sp. TaxID=2910988 RepID=UPI002B7644DC|nr:ASKHA domain-containing protein [Humidesulfovibrio sp.]HWR04128.1 ASKHA domain-containing protein [Humidesulfovibrio sp.]
MIRIHTHDGQHLELAPDQRLTLAQAIFLAPTGGAGLWDGVPLCAGLGKCGLCRVRYVSAAPQATADEARRLGQASLDQGWRLSCLHPAETCDIELPEPKRSGRPRQGQPQPAQAAQADADIALAVDLGTTSVHWTALMGRDVLASGQELNPQMGLGSEVMSRLGFAARPGGAEILQNLILDRLRQLARAAGARAGRPVTRLCVAGNSAMTYILLGLPVGGLARAPYSLGYAGGDDRSIAPDLPETRIPPLLAPFVGGDLSAGLAALTFGPEAPRYPFLLADLGTNGEFVLALSPSEYLLASVPMGPALEGVGLRHGRTAAAGAVRAFALTPAGLKPEYVERPPLPDEDPGITGVGYLSLAAALLRAGVLDESGRFMVPATPLGQRLAKGLASVNGEASLALGSGLFLPASDVEELVKVKAAFNLALSRLLAEAALPASALAAVHLAGAMGEHVSARDLVTLGFLPEALAGVLLRAGNTSLKGSQLLLNSPEAWDWVRALPAKCRALDLASDPGFGSLYVERMVLRHVA